MTSIRVLLADDHSAIRASLRLLVDSESDMSVIGEASNGQEAVALTAQLHPDVVLMDVNMPTMNGLEALRELSTRMPQSRIVVLTMFDLDSYLYEALRAGASGFLLKNSPPADVLHAIRVAHEGHALLAPEMTKRLIGQFASVKRDPALEHLTARELETLVLIGQGRSNTEIADALFVTVPTVRTYVSRILTKVHARDRAGLVVIAYENALVGNGSS